MDIHALEFVKLINTKTDKQSNIEKLGSYLYSQLRYTKKQQLAIDTLLLKMIKGQTIIKLSGK